MQHERISHGRGRGNRGRMRRRISPAMLVALLALFFSLTGAGMAATGFRITSLSQIAPNVRHELRGARGPRGFTGAAGPQGPAGPQGAPGANSGASVLWADVAPSGTLNEGRGIAATSEQGDQSAPVYDVRFDGPVAVGCVHIQEALGSPGDSVTVSPVSGDTFQVRVTDPQAQQTASEFVLIVIC
jgi:hypothetical protein